MKLSELWYWLSSANGLFGIVCMVVGCYPAALLFLGIALCLITVAEILRHYGH